MLHWRPVRGRVDPPHRPIRDRAVPAFVVDLREDRSSTADLLGCIDRENELLGVVRPSKDQVAHEGSLELVESVSDLLRGRMPDEFAILVLVRLLMYVCLKWGGDDGKLWDVPSVVVEQCNPTVHGLSVGWKLCVLDGGNLVRIGAIAVGSDDHAKEFSR